MKKQLPLLLVLLAILMFLILPIFFIRYLSSSATTNLSGEFYKTPILGGFSIDTADQGAKAAKEGVQIAFEYGEPPSVNNRLGQEFQSLHMRVVDGYIASYLYYYECHRTALLRPTLLGPGQYCQNDRYPYLKNESVLLATIAAHLKRVKENQLVIGYWVLDDWVKWDAGSGQPILQKIRQLIQQYTPGRPAICGFGGTIGLHHGYSWEDWIADNFSSQGCDMVGYYIYTPSLPNTISPSPPDAYNWSMDGVLPAMFASLQKRGWSLNKEPLIGIGQAFGGRIAQTNDYSVTPTAKDIAVQSRSFCEHGAAGLAFFAWDSSGFGPDTKTPMNSSQISLGIRDGIAACKQYWGKHPPLIPTSNAN